MSKTAVYRYDDDNQPIEAEGWFTPELAEAIGEADPMTAERFEEQRRNKHHKGGVRSVVETLYRTPDGRWVHKCARHVDARGRWGEDETNAAPRLRPPRYKFYSEAEALDWLHRNGRSDRIEAYFADQPDEKGPGRPEIGGRVQVRLGQLLPQVDAYAVTHECTRAEAVRLLVLAGLAADA